MSCSIPVIVEVRGVKEDKISEGYVYFEFTDIPAAELAKLQSHTINGTTYYSSVLTYARAVLKAGNNVEPEETALAKATYWYYWYAKAFFG